MALIPKLEAGQWPSSADVDAGLLTLQSFDPDSLPADTLAGLAVKPTAPALLVTPDDLINLPIPPIVQEVGDDISLAFDILDIIAWFFVENAEFPWDELIGAILIIVGKLLKLFTGRPRQTATLTAAGNLVQAKNTAAIIAGNNFIRLFNQFDIVLSTSGPGEALVAANVSQFVDNLVAQGIPQATARDVVLNQLTLGANRVGFIAPQLQKAPPDDLILQGTTGFQNNFSRIEKWLEDHGKTPIEADRITWQYLLQNAPLKWLFRIKYQPPGTPPPPPVCPPGYEWDPGLQTCVQVAQNPPPPTCPPGTVYNPVTNTCDPITSIPDPQGDEIVNQLCKQMAANTASVIQAINGLASGLNAGDPACCAALTGAIGDVAATLADIASAFPLADNVAQLIAPMQAIADAIANAGAGGSPVDLSRIEAALQTIAENAALKGNPKPTPKISPAWIDDLIKYWVANWGVDAGAGQAITAVVIPE